jgi:hypothetical protein
MQGDNDLASTTLINHQQNVASTQNQNNIHEQQNSINSPNINESSPYSSVFLSRDMIALSPINNTSSPQYNRNTSRQQIVIDITTQSPNGAQNDSDIMLPRNLSNSFPTPMQDAINKNNQDLGNHSPGTDT